MWQPFRNIRQVRLWQQCSLSCMHRCCCPLSISPASVVGKLIGKKHIFPELSPHKSLEGCIGGVAGAALIGGLYAHFFVEAAFPDQIITWTIAFICAAGAVMSMVGDLAASAIKRNHNIKDYGKLIPGHGGIMDRFDSMTVTAPMTYFLAILMIGLR